MAESNAQLQLISLTAIAAFCALMIYLGFRSRSKTKTMEGFLLGGREIGAWMSAFAYGTSYFSAVIFIGYAGTHGWNIGMAAMWIGVGNAIFGSWLAWRLLAARTRKMTHNLGVKTMPEFFEARYGEPVMKIFSAVVIFVFLVPYSAAVYKGLGSLFNTIFPNVHVNICMLAIAVITGIFLVLGGYVASVYTNFAQGIIMIAGVVIMVALVAFNPIAGGPFAAFRHLKTVDPGLVDIFGGSNFSFLCVNILLTSFGTWGLPQMVSKYYAIKDDAAIKKGTAVSTVFALLIGAGAYYVGSFGRIYVDGTAAGAPVNGFDAVVPQILLKALGGSNILSALVLTAILVLLLSASISTLSAVVLTSASAVSVDMLPFVFPKLRSKDANQVRLTKTLCLLFVVLSYLFATVQIAIIVSIMSFSWGVVSGCFIGPYIWGLYSRKTTKTGAWSGMLGGFLTIAVLTLVKTVSSGFGAAIANAPVYGVLAMAVSVAAVPLVSSFTRRLPGEIIAKAYREK